MKILEPDEVLRPDMSVRIHFLAEAKPATEGDPVVLAPRAAVRVENGASYAWVVTEGRLRRVALTLGEEMGDRVVIRSGLLGGEALVVGDVAGLADGRKVAVAGS